MRLCKSFKKVFFLSLGAGARQKAHPNFLYGAFLK